MALEHYIFDDFDAFANTVHGIDAQMLINNASRREWEITQLHLKGVHIQVGSLGSGNIVEGQSWQNKVASYLPLSPSIMYLANSSRAQKNQFVILEPSTDFCISTKNPHDWVTIFVDLEALTAFHTDLEPPKLDRRRCCVAPQLDFCARRFTFEIREMLFAASNCDDFQASPAARLAAEELIKLSRTILSTIAPGSRPSSRIGRPRLSRSAIIRTCKAYLCEDQVPRELSPRTLAVLCGVSERSIRQAFHDYFGYGPNQYFQILLLNQIRSALRKADPSATQVGQVLVSFGVWEFGRFALRYQKLFGELPSQTLRMPNRAFI